MSLSPFEKAASGALASAVANTLVYPLDLSKTLIQTQVAPSSTTKSIPSFLESGLDPGLESGSNSLKAFKYKNTVDCLKQIYRKRGVLGWYHGLFSSIVGTAAQNFSYFYWYTIVKRVYANLTKHKTNHKPSTLTELFLGALAAAISQMFTMPIGVITTQQQTDKSSKNLLEIAKDIYEQNGVTGFWKGLRVSLVLCINPSITYGSYERLRFALYGTKQFLGPLESFSLGVMAKSLATVSTQPLIVSKALLQKKSNKKTTLGAKGKEAAEGSEEPEEVKFEYFTDALSYLWETERFNGLYKGIAPQLLKGVVVQGLLFTFKDQLDILFLFLLNALRSKRGLAPRQ